MIEVKHAILKLHDEVPAIGTGSRPVLFWEVGETIFAYWHPSMTVFRFDKARWARFSKTISEGYDVKARARAVAVNRSKAITNKEWDGGQLVELMLRAIAGEEVSELEFTSMQEAKTLAYPPDALGPFERGQHVTLSYDADFKGRILRSGPEVSTIEPEGEKGKEVHIPNGKIVKLDTPTAEKPKAKGKADKKSAEAKPEGTAKPESVEEDMAKKAAKKSATKKAAPKAKATSSRLKGRAVMTIAENPRKKGTLGYDMHQKFHNFVKGNPKASLAEAMDKAGATARDVAHMVAKKHIKIVNE